MTDIDILIIGGGIVGFACAREFALRNGAMSIIVADRSVNPGDGVSGRNSGVLHAGIYYQNDSRKAYHCVRGNRMTHELAEAWNIPVLKCGKYITTGASDSKEDRQRKESLIEEILANAERNGATGLSLEKNLPEGILGSLAIYSKNTSVIDAAAYLKAMRSKAESAGVIFLPGRSLEPEGEVKENPDGTIDVELQGSDGPERIRTRLIVNAAGLHCDEIATLAGLKYYEIRPVRGEYYSLKKALYNTLIYPLPDPESTALGVHYTIHPSSEAYAGPNALPAGNKSDYRITATATDFYNSLCRIVEGYKQEDLSPGYSGIRPRLHLQNGEAIKDFRIERSRNWIHLLGIESPGLTSAVSLAQEAAEIAGL